MKNEELVEIINFWHQSLKPKKLISRELIQSINLKNKEVVDIIGVRRSGKSSILKLIIQKLKLKNNFLFINFEDPFFVHHRNSKIIEDLITTYEIYFSKNLEYLFFDEIQNVEKWEKAIRKFRDCEKYKIFITGSSSKLLSGELASVLTGRHLSHIVYPLDFKEFLFFNNLKIKTKKDLIIKNKSIQKFFDEYLKTGGFPEMVITGNLILLKQYFFDILQKDVISRYEIRDKAALEKIAVFLISNVGKIISLRSIEKAFDILFPTLVSYLEYLKEAFLIFDLPQFSYSLKTMAKAQKKIYTIDTGLANAVSFRFSEDKGRILEQCVFTHLKKTGAELFYYKTKKNTEVDFFVKNTKKRELIQVAWSLENEETKKREINSLLTAMEELKLNHGLILTHDESEEIAIGNKLITVTPAYKWILSFSS
jgi:uncharacterized protein